MSKIITIHSIRKGTGKSHIAANLAVLLTAEGRRVALLEANMLAPTMRSIFNRRDTDEHSLEDYLLDRCDIGDVVYDLTDSLRNVNNGKANDASNVEDADNVNVADQVQGQLFLVPSAGEPADVFNLLRDGFPTERFNGGIEDLITDLNLDVVIIDSPAGLAEETLSLLALTDILRIVMFLDHREYQGTGATLDVARRLNVGDVAILVNDVPELFNYDQVRSEVSETYDCPVTVLPHSEELLTMAGRGIFIQEYPDHPLASAIREAAATLTA